jgi:hypothetical protein
VAAVAILVVNVPPRGLARSQSELGIASAALDLASGAEREQNDGDPSSRRHLRAADLNKVALEKKNLSHQKWLADQFSYTPSQTDSEHLAIPARVVRDFHKGELISDRNDQPKILQKSSKTATGEAVCELWREWCTIPATYACERAALD